MLVDVLFIYLFFRQRVVYIIYVSDNKNKKLQNCVGL